MTRWVDADGCTLLPVPVMHKGPATEMDRTVYPHWNPDWTGWGPCRLTHLLIGPRAITDPSEEIAFEVGAPSCPAVAVMTADHRVPANGAHA